MDNCSKLTPSRAFLQDVDEEFVILFMVYDENQSHYLQTNIDMFGGDPNDAVSGPIHDR